MPEVIPVSNSILSKQQRVVSAPPRKTFTQGVIFKCGVAADYENCDTYGLAITARCDVANDKVHIYNYLPVVTLDDWLHRDGRIILAERLSADASGALRTLLKDIGYSPVVLETESLEFVVDKFFPDSAVEKSAIAARKRATELVQRYVFAQEAARSTPEDRILLKFALSYPKLLAKLIDELVRQQLGGYYFIEQVDVNGEDRGFVVLVREIQVIPKKLAHLIMDGLDSHMFSTLCQTVPEFKGRLQIKANDVSMPVGIVRSPNVEHLMQSFALLFSRIGVVDITSGYVGSLLSRQPSILEVAQ